MHWDGVGKRKDARALCCEHFEAIRETLQIVYLQLKLLSSSVWNRSNSCDYFLGHFKIIANVIAKSCNMQYDISKYEE